MRRARIASVERGGSGSLDPGEWPIPAPQGLGCPKSQELLTNYMWQIKAPLQGSENGPLPLTRPPLIGQETELNSSPDDNNTTN